MVEWECGEGGENVVHGSAHSQRRHLTVVASWSGGITSRGKTALVVVDGNLNARRYIDYILQPVIVPYK